MSLKALSLFTKEKQLWWLLVIILLITTFLRFYQLGVESLWMDEVASIHESGLSITQIAIHSNQPPLYFLVLRFWTTIWGNSEFAVRSLSSIVGIVGVGVIYIVGHTLFDRRVALIAAFLSTFSAFQIYYSQEARGYILLMLLTALSFLFFFRMLRSSHTYWYIAYLISSLLMGYTHYYSWFIIAAQLLFLLMFRPRDLRLKWNTLLTYITLFCLLIPQLILLNTSYNSLTSRSFFWIPIPSLKTVGGTLGLFSASPEWLPGFYAILAIFTGLSILGLVIFKKIDTPAISNSFLWYLKNLLCRVKLEKDRESILLIIWLVIPILIAFVVSRFFTPIYWHRYLICSLPPLVLLVSKGLAKISSKSIFYPMIAIIVILSTPGLYQYYAHDVKEQWREVAKYIELNYHEDDVLVFNRDLGKDAFDYYFKKNTTEIIDDNNFKDLSTIASILGTSQGNHRYWFVFNAFAEPDMVQDYLVTNYGFQSVLIERQYVGISVILFYSVQ